MCQNLPPILLQAPQRKAVEQPQKGTGTDDTLALFWLYGCSSIFARMFHPGSQAIRPGITGRSVGSNVEAFLTGRIPI